MFSGIRSTPTASNFIFPIHPRLRISKASKETVGAANVGDLDLTRIVRINHGVVEVVQARGRPSGAVRLDLRAVNDNIRFPWKL